MITLVALLLVSNIAFKLSDLQYDALVAQIPSQQSYSAQISFLGELLALILMSTTAQ